MAVQAQYPSNVLLFNRGIQEGKNQLIIGNDYSMQPQPGGGFLDQPHLIFNNINAAAPVGNNNNNNPRKRGREINETNSTPMNSMISSMQLPQQIQAPRLIDVTQLHTPPPQNAVVSTGLRLAFGDQQQLQNHHHQQQQQNSLSTQSSIVLSLLSEDFAAQIKHQREEIDQILQTQGDQLRRTLAEKRQRHYRALLGAAEESVARKLREKEAEVEKAARRNAELQARAAQLTAEAQVWQATARAQEATAATLQAQLQQAIIRGGGCGQQQDGVLSCAAAEGAEDAESAYIDPDRVEISSGQSCKACQKRVASVVLLPCRHLCVCTECDGVVQACPLCLSFRSSSVEVFFT